MINKCKVQSAKCKVTKDGLKAFIEQFLTSPPGFTLIELIVVFGTIAFVSTIGIVSYVNYSQSQSLEAAVKDLVTTIQLAKSRANSQVKPPSSYCQGQLDGYSVVISRVNKQYSLGVVCGGNAPYPLFTTKLPKNITFHQDTTTELFFAVISGAVGGGGIGITGYDKTKFIQVDSIGIITQVSVIPTQTPPTPTPTITPTPTLAPP